MSTLVFSTGLAGLTGFQTLDPAPRTRGRDAGVPDLPCAGALWIPNPVNPVKITPMDRSLHRSNHSPRRRLEAMDFAIRGNCAELAEL